MSGAGQNSVKAEDEGGTVNLAFMNRSRLLWQMLLAILSGALLSLSFPPVGCSYLAWLALVPMLAYPMPRERLARLLCGYLFGYTHFAMMLYWLNEVGFGAGWLLSIYCALYPMAWYLLAGSLLKRIMPPDELHPAIGLCYVAHLKRGCFSGILLAALWVMLEWIRSWLMTGFPWGMAGISQYMHPSVVRLSSVTGVYGISFLIILCNCTFAVEICRAVGLFFYGVRLCGAWHFIIFGISLGLGILPIFARIPDAPEEAPMLQFAAVQGNIPQCRDWSREEYQYAVNSYDRLSRLAVQEHPELDFILWPECAVPASFEYQPYRASLIKLQSDTRKPLLTGMLMNRLPFGTTDIEQVHSFNSVVLLDEKAHVQACYDKMHRVPFGEYVPFGSYFPKLYELIGMGRDLSAGNVPFVFALPKGGRAGVNICFEDVFPSISRMFTLEGANILMTVTNDSWYNQSCAAEQHTAHAIFRAAENRRPFMRSGNNSHTLMISPAGKPMGQLVGENTPFVQGYQAYEMPVSNDWGMTFYTKYGDVFAVICSIAGGISIAVMFVSAFRRRRRIHDKR